MREERGSMLVVHALCMMRPSDRLPVREKNGEKRLVIPPASKKRGKPQDNILAEVYAGLQLTYIWA